MYNKVFKNYQVNVGIPFQVKTPLNFHTIKEIHNKEQSEDRSINESNMENQEFILEKVREESEFILKEARYEALRLIENAEAEIEESKSQAEEEARKKGYEDGIHEAKKQYEDILQEAEFIKEHAKAEYNEVLESIESDAVNMILEIAKKVIGVEISFNKENILYLVKQAFEKCANKENLVIRVSQEDHSYLIENKERLLSMVEGICELEIKKDTSLKVGACVVETVFGNIDASIQTKMNKIENAFRQIIKK